MFNSLLIYSHFFEYLIKSKSLSIFSSMLLKHSLTKLSNYFVGIWTISSFLPVSLSLFSENLEVAAALFDLAGRTGFSSFLRVSLTFFTFFIYSALLSTVNPFFLFSWVSFRICTSFFKFSFLAAMSSWVLACLNFINFSLSSLSFLLSSIFWSLKFLISLLNPLIVLLCWLTLL